MVQQRHITAPGCSLLVAGSVSMRIGCFAWSQSVLEPRTPADTSTSLQPVRSLGQARSLQRANATDVEASCVNSCAYCRRSGKCLCRSRHGPAWCRASRRPSAATSWGATLLKSMQACPTPTADQSECQSDQEDSETQKSMPPHAWLLRVWSWPNLERPYG